VLTIIVSILIGLMIWRIDAQPNWDDAGITAGMILLSTGLISFSSPKRPYFCAIAVSIWIPLFGIIKDGNFGSLLTFLFGFLGAYGGSALGNRFKSAS